MTFYYILLYNIDYFGANPGVVGKAICLPPLRFLTIIHSLSFPIPGIKKHLFNERILSNKLKLVGMENILKRNLITSQISLPDCRSRKCIWRPPCHALAQWLI